MKLLAILTLLLSLAPKASYAFENASIDTAYDENTFSEEFLSVISDAGDEPQLTSSHEDISRARVVAVINKSKVGSTSQKIRVYVDGTLAYEWLVSTGREKLEVAKSGRKYLTTTPVGYYRPTTIELNHFSKTWKADMPHAVFFNGGIAVHASTHIDQLGTRASGGCVRLAPENAKTFYELVKSVGYTLVPKITRDGKTVLDANGNPVMIKNWNVLIIVENHA